MTVETKQQFPFVVGTKVAFIPGSNWGRRISPRVVGKVRKDGKFFLNNYEGVVSETMWTPENSAGYGGIWRANKSGDKGYMRDHVELWTEKHDQELDVERARHDRAKRIARVKGAVEAMRDGDASVDKLLDAIEVALTAEAEVAS